LHLSHSSKNVQWHQIFAYSLKLALSPVDIKVFSEIEVTAKPPRADILLLCNNSSRWTKQQRARLPDKIRDQDAGHVLIEFKYSESLDESVYQKTAGYDIFYRTANELSATQVQTYIVMSNTPRLATLERNGYRPDRLPGIWVSEIDIFRRIPVILLNELALTPHNLAFKLFASRMEQRRKVIRKIQETSEWVDATYEKMVTGLYWIWFEEAPMRPSELTADKIMEMGEVLGKRYLELLPPEMRLEGLSPSDILKVYKPSKFFAGIPARERIDGLSARERISGLSARERTDGLSDEELIALLQERKRKKSNNS
jgi:hypothetical protein